MLSKNTCEGVHLIVKLPAISLQASKFTKNELLQTYFSRIFNGHPMWGGERWGTLFYGTSGHGKGLVDAMSSFGVKAPIHRAVLMEDFSY